jgi:hypothetical protein
VKAPSCLYHLTLGKRHWKYAPSAYRVCVTATQAKRLFGSTEKPKPVACGVFACVFQHSDPDKVVKVTRDSSDVAGIMKGQGAQVPKLYDVHRLASGARWLHPRPKTERYQSWPDEPEAYAMVLEKLRTLTGDEKARWQRRIRRMQHFILAERQKRERMAEREATTPDKPGAEPRPAYQPPTLRDLAKAVCPRRPEAEAKSCELQIRELDKVSVDLAKRGIDWSDVHAGNIGFDKHGRLKALDVGASTTPLDTELPELAGRKR